MNKTLFTRKSHRKICDHYIASLDDIDCFDFYSITSNQVVILDLNKPIYFNRLIDRFLAVLGKHKVNKFRLVTINVSEKIPRHLVDVILNSNQISHWFTENWPYAFQDPKITIIPIGVAENFARHWKPADWKPLEDKKPLCLATFQHGIPVIARSGSPNDRLDCLKALYDQEWISWAPKMDIQAYIRALSEHAFVISPLGTRLDCHRTWEALACGSVPIVKRSTLIPLWRQFPVCILDEWSKLEKEKISICLSNFQNYTTVSALEMLTENYWRDRITGKLETSVEGLVGKNDIEWQIKSEQEIIPMDWTWKFLRYRNPLYAYFDYMTTRLRTREYVNFNAQDLLSDFRRLKTRIWKI